MDSHLPIVDSTANIKVVLDISKLLLENINSASYCFTPEQINWINQFIAASPESFHQLSSDISNITSTGKIGLQDIPKLVHLCADIYNNAAIKNGLSNPKNVIEFIKFTIDTIMTCKYLILPEVEKELIHQLVDTSLNLLIMNLEPIEAEIVELENTPCFKSILQFFHVA